MSEPAFRGAPPPPRGGRRTYRVVRPLPNRPLRVTLLGPVQGYWTHWDPHGGRAGSGRTILCTGAGRCPHPHDGIGHHWYGYAPSYDLDRREFVVSTWTSSAARELLELVCAEESPRGVSVSLAKEGALRQSQIAVCIIDACRAGPCPQTFDIGESLIRLFHLSALPDEMVDYARDFRPAPPTEEGARGEEIES